MKPSMVNRMRLATAIAAIILVVTGFAHAGAATSHSEKPQKAKAGMLNITFTTEVVV